MWLYPFRICLSIVSVLQNMGISSVFIDVGKEAVAHYTPCSIREMELWHSITAAETERELYSTDSTAG